MKILLVNDDGYRSPGIHALILALKAEHELTVAVPAMEQSGKSHCITFSEPVTCDRFYLSEVGHDIHMVHGTPADCVLMALDQIMTAKPDLVISGINKGHNAGGAIIYSGTVSAAYEGASRGISSFALSADFIDANFTLAAKMFKAMLPTVLEQEQDELFFYNVNFPNLPLSALKGIRKTTVARRQISEKMEKRMDPFQREYYWRTYDSEHFANICDEDGSDMRALREGYISVTPLKLNYFDEKKFERMTDFSDVFSEIKALK
ncbi:MAG TPA: 5'/3'-nucleotidase SurE [Clostridiales bacterium]|nr:5'/3'-nucleotidase SurE [Clostridiales bacterium]